jgi:hypothetical protein
MKTEARLQDLRTGWRKWCDLCSADECTNPDQARGFALAAEANDGGGNRPTKREANDLTAADLTEPVAVYIQPEIDGQTFACDASNNRIDTIGGPADFLARFYLRSGYRVFGVDGREVTISGE